MINFVTFFDEDSGNGFVCNITDISYIKKSNNKLFMKTISGKEDILIFESDGVRDKSTINVVSNNLNTLMTGSTTPINDSKLKVPPESCANDHH